MYNFLRNRHVGRFLWRRRRHGFQAPFMSSFYVQLCLHTSQQSGETFPISTTVDGEVR